MSGPSVHHLPASRHRLGPFVVHRPRSLAEAVDVRASLPGDVRLLAGGLDLLNELKNGAPCDHLIDLMGVEPLHDFVVGEASLDVGSLVTHRRFERAPETSACASGLGGIWSSLGNVRVRNAGTLAGNLMAGNVQYDVAPVLCSLGAQVRFADGSRVAVEEGLVGCTGLVEAIEIPLHDRAAVGLQRDLKPVLSCAVSLVRDAEGRFQAVATFGCMPPGTRLQLEVDGLDSEAIAAGADDLAAAAIADGRPRFPDDHLASGTYRRRVAPVLVARQLALVASQLTGKGERIDDN